MPMASSQPIPTLTDVGRAAGVSTATASMAMRGDPRISAATRLRVRQAARKLHYVPDPMLAALVARRDRNQQRHTFANISALVDNRWTKDDTWIDSLLAGMRDAATRIGYSLDFINIQRDLHSNPHPDRFLSGRGIRGVIILPIRTQPLAIPLQWSRYATVAIGSPPDGMRPHRTGTDAFAAMTMVCAQLRQLGYRRVGLVNSFDAEQRNRYEWLGSLCKEAVINPAFTVVPPHLPTELIAKNLDDWARQYQPECLITNDGRCRPFLIECGWKIPRDIGIAVLSRNTPEYATFSGVAQHLDDTGEAAVEQLHNMLMRGETGLPEVPREILVTAHWNPGKTTRRLRRQS